MQEIAERYIASWNETDPQRRRELIGELWAEDASCTDPLTEARGQNEISEMIGAVQGQFPGLAFSLAGPVDAHHRQAASPGRWVRRAASRWRPGSTSPSRTTTAGWPASSASSTRSPPEQPHRHVPGRAGRRQRRHAAARGDAAL